MRNLLAEYWELHWPNKGTVKWAYIVRLFETQKSHYGVRLANKLTSKHVNYKKNKMKVCLATQLFSRSVSKSLVWCHEQKVPGFESKDVLVTSEFISLHNDLFDILNSRALAGRGLKAALTVDNLHIAQETFRKFENLYKVLEGPGGKKIIHSRRKTGPLGFISCIKTAEKLVADMKNGSLPLQFLRFHKLQQDHLETWFSQIRQRNGWSYNPTALQFRFAYRTLLLHNGKTILRNGRPLSNGTNCIPQDETFLLTVSKKALFNARIMSESNDRPENVLNETDETVIDKTIHEGCVIQDCVVCRASLAYIAGFYVRSLQKKIMCEECVGALESSDEDKCPDTSLIQLKNVYEGHLHVPSGSLCRLLYLNERVLRKNLTLVNSNTGDLEGKLLLKVLKEVNDNEIFPILSVFHALETCEGIDNHYLLLVQLVSRKYLRLRIKNILKDNARARSLGNGNEMTRKRVIYHE